MIKIKETHQEVVLNLIEVVLLLYQNNAIQNSAGLTKVDKHNYRKYDNNQNDIEIIKGSSSLVDDVKKII